jgi:hypothetical protein
MNLHDEIAADFDALVAEHGTSITIGNSTLNCLLNRSRNSQEAGIGGFVDSPVLSARVRLGATPPPAEGVQVVAGGRDYLVANVSSHPSSPITTINLIGADQ